MLLPSPTGVSHAARRLKEAVRGGALEIKDRSAPRLSFGLRLWVRLFSAQDTILVAYLLVVTGLLWRRGALASPGARPVLACLAAIVAACVVSRAGDLPARVRSHAYCLATVAVLAANYLMLRELLPLIRHDDVDDVLFRLDVRLFGVAPVLWLERLNRPLIIEWFSFFYFSYFFLCFAYVVGVLWLDRRDRHMTEFGIACALVYCGGQLGYMAVPAYGPVRFLAGEFAAPLGGGLFWGLVSRAVDTGGALKDAFPSIHTAAPLLFTGFAFARANRDRRWRWPARATAFFTVNILASTVVLRWHYVVDVFAGVALVVAARSAARWLARAEEGYRARAGLPGPWRFDHRPRGGAE